MGRNLFNQLQKDGYMNHYKEYYESNSIEEKFRFESCTINASLTKSQKTDSNHTIIGIAGGPGLPKSHLCVLSKISEVGYDVLLYDQHNIGNSDDHPHPYSLDTFHKSLENIIENFSSVSLIGHSWGSMLILDYLCSKEDYTSDRVEKIVLVSPLFDTQDSIIVAKSRRNTVLSPDEIEKINKLEAEKQFNTDEYQKIEEKVESNLTFQPPMPSFMEDVYCNFNEDMYEGMWGPSEFTLSKDGVLKDWSVKNNLSRVKKPALLITGEDDLFGVQDMFELQHRFGGETQVKVIQNASHTPMWEKPEEFLQEVSEWLKKEI